MMIRKIVIVIFVIALVAELTNLGDVGVAH